MKNFVLSFVPLSCGVVIMAAACGWSQAQPTLVLELSHVTRGKLSEGAFTRSTAVAFTAAVSMALERAAWEPAPSTRERAEGDAALEAPYPRGDLEAVDRARDAFEAAARELQPLDASCETAALCAWAQAAEGAAFAAAADHSERVP